MVDIFHTGYPLDESLTYTSLETARRFYDVSDVINGISVRLDFNRDREVAAEIKKTGYKAKGWTETNPAILQAIALKSTSNNIIFSLIIVIASFGVVSTLNLAVLGATSQIGMLRAMGATVSSIRTIFILQSGILGLLGALAGTLTGVAISIAIGQYEIPPAASSSSFLQLHWPYNNSLYNSSRGYSGHYYCCFSAEFDCRDLSSPAGGKTGPCESY